MSGEAGKDQMGYQLSTEALSSDRSVFNPASDVYCVTFVSALTSPNLRFLISIRDDSTTSQTYHED